MGPQYAVEASEYLFEVTGDNTQIGALFMQAMGLKAQLHLTIKGLDAPRQEWLLTVKLETHGINLE